MSYSLGFGSKLILSGGGDETQSFLLDNFFLQNISNNGSILYVPVALRGHRLFEGAGSWFKSVLLSHGREDIQVTVLNDLNTILDFGNFDAIYIGGGNTWSLLQEIINSNSKDSFKNYISLKNKIIYGGSAGAIVLGKNISCQNDNKIISFTDERGLDLLNDYSVTCHYEGNEKQSSLIQEWLISNKTELLALSEDGGVVFSENKIEKVFGDGHFLFTGSEKKALV